MSTSHEIDLDALTRERKGGSELRPPRRTLRWLVPLALLLGFGALLAWSLGDALRGALEVRILRPVPVLEQSGAPRSSSGVVAQAAGWVEPDPFPVRVTALVPGVVRELYVQESERVEAGEVVARLFDEEARLVVARARASCERSQAERALAAAELAAAEASFEAALEVRERAAAAHARLDGRRAEAEHRAQAVLKGRAQVTLAEEELLVQRELAAAGAAGPRQVEIAQARVAEARGELAILEADAALAAADAREAQAAEERAARDLELRIEERLRVEGARARLALASAQCDENGAMLASAELALERTELRAPVGGIVLERLATPGSELAGEATAALTLYDPTSIRVRVDVPQQDLAQLFVGQRAEIESDARPGRPYAGEVLRIVRRADIQKVTLQAQVRVLEEADLLRPEMLVQVRFFGREPEGSAGGPGASAARGAAVAIPARLLVDGSRAWIVGGESQRAELRELKLGARRGELVVVEEGLDLSHELIDADPRLLRPGLRVREVR